MLTAVRENPAGLSFRSFESLMKALGWQFKRQKGSHRLWYSPAGYRLPNQRSGNKAKAYQVRQFLMQYQKENVIGGKASKP